MKKIIYYLLLTLSLTSKAQIPKLNSLPGTPAVIYLDFDGQTVNSGVWNNGNPIFCQSPNLSNPIITETFERVAEDYKLFKINVTTDSTVFLAAPLTQRIRIIITPTNFFGGAGVAYMNSFIWGDDTPGFVFVDANVTAKFLGEACSHESGHALGCAHQSIYNIYCEKTNEYNAGQGDGEIGWAPIMGFSVDRTFTTWFNGKRSISCDNQDDIAVIASKIIGGGLKTDDVSNTIALAANMNIVGNNVSASGLINSNNDIDMFKITVSESSVLKLTATPPKNSNNQNLGNIDILFSLLNSSGTVIKSYNIVDSLNAKIDTILNAGTYYISVDGTSNTNVNSDYGSSGSYNIFGTLQTTLSLPIYTLDIRGSINNAQHVINWNIVADEPIVKTVLEYATDGIQFNSLQLVDYRNNSYSYKPFSSNIIYYRLKAYLRDGSFKISNIISLQSAKTNNVVQILNNRVNNQILVTVQENTMYQLLDMSGKLTNKGTLLTNRVNTINTEALTRGIYILKTISNNNTFSQRIIKD